MFSLRWRPGNCDRCCLSHGLWSKTLFVGTYNSIEYCKDYSNWLRFLYRGCEHLRRCYGVYERFKLCYKMASVHVFSVAPRWCLFINPSCSKMVSVHVVDFVLRWRLFTFSVALRWRPCTWWALTLCLWTFRVLVSVCVLGCCKISSVRFCFVIYSPKRCLLTSVRCQKAWLLL